MSTRSTTAKGTRTTENASPKGATPHAEPTGPANPAREAGVSPRNGRGRASSRGSSSAPVVVAAGERVGDARAARVATRARRVVARRIVPTQTAEIALPETDGSDGAAVGGERELGAIGTPGLTPGGIAGGDAIARVRAHLAASVGPEAFERYFVQQSRLELVSGQLRVHAASGFMATLIDRRFGGMLRAAAGEAGLLQSGEPVRVLVDAGASGAADQNERATAAASAPASARKTSETPDEDEPVPSVSRHRAGRSAPSARGSHAAGTGLARQHRLERFVVGESNQLAYSAAVSAADPSRGALFQSLFIHGPCGTGKTHLLQGIASAYRKASAGGARAGRAPTRGPSHAGVRYMTGEAFTNAFVSAVREGKMDAFRDQFRGVELFCIDDVHFVGNKQQTQQELQHLFDRLMADGARIVIASDAPPQQIEKLNRTLGSRFASGMVVRIDPPDASLQRRLVERFAQERDLPLTREAADLIAQRAGRLGATAGGASVRDIEGMLTQVDAVYRLLPELCAEPGRIGASLVRRALGLSAGDTPAAGATASPRRPITLTTILAEVCRELRVERDEVMGRGRHKRVVMTRALVTLLARRMTTASFPEIARALGRPNHSTVITAYRRIEGQIAEGELVALGLESDGLTIGELASRVESVLGQSR